MYQESQVVEKVREIQRRMGDGDEIVIWKDELQVSEDGKVSTNYSHPKPIRLQDLQDRIEDLEVKLGGHLANDFARINNLVDRLDQTVNG